MSLKLERKKIGLKQREMAEVFGISLTSYQKIEQGTNRITIDKLKKMHELGMSIHSIVLGDSVSENSKKIDFLDIKASCGTGVQVFDERIIENIQVNIEQLKQHYNITYKSSLKVITASGDSMRPTYNDKDLILIDTEHLDFKDGLWVFVDNNELFIKRLQKTPKAIFAISDNNLYPKFEISNQTKLIAKVIGVWGFAGL